MSFATGYRGTANGAVQTAVNDQVAVAVAGMLAFASDHNLIDAIAVGETDGVAAGVGVIYDAGDTAVTTLQFPNQVVKLPVGTESASDFKGIVVFEEAMQSDEDGNNGWALNRMARILRPTRQGGRIWVAAKAAITLTDTVNWVVDAPDDASFDLGDFSPDALGGGAAGTSVVLPNARWVSAAAEGEYAILELGADIAVDAS